MAVGHFHSYHLILYLPHFVILLTCLLTAEAGWPLEHCGPPSGLEWDYADPKNWQPSGDARQGRIKLVENTYFTPEVRQLKRGNTTVDPLGDIAYTLTRFPNHYPALETLSIYMRFPGVREKAIKRAAQEGTWARTAECFFVRAIRFKPDDAVVRALFGKHLHRLGHLQDALSQYQVAEKLGLDKPAFHYRYGLLLVDLGEYEQAKERAKKAYNLGHSGSHLRGKLKAAGHWP